MSKPLLLLDIDGVLNAFAARRPDARYRRAEAEGYQLVLHVDHPQWIAQLEAVFAIVWATMWQDKAHSFGRVAGFGTAWDYLDFDAHVADKAGRLRQMTGVRVGGYKWPAVLDVAAQGQPFVWIDDDLEDWQLSWAESRARSGSATLFLRPDSWIGMTREHVDAMLDFAATLRRT